jgi:DNA-binding response OmpR family regulator
VGRPQKYPAEFQREAVELVKTSDRSRVEIARSLGISDSTLANWMAADREATTRATDPDGLSESEREELRRLRKENIELRTDREFGREVMLTALELELLSYFLMHPDEPITRARLLEAVWGYSIGGTATVTVHVRRLREKIEVDPANPVLIRTVWGGGYRFSPSAT